MPVCFGFLDADGSEKEVEDLNPVQQAFLILNEMGIGIPRLDRNSLDEFVRRADLMQAYIAPIWRNGDGTVRIFGRADFLELLPKAWTNWGFVPKTQFDQMIEREREAYRKASTTKS
jgi:hypothetical protein